MEENVQVRDELSLAEIFRILLVKMKFLFLALLGGLIIGAGIGASNSWGINYYGTSAEFHINPIPAEVEDSTNTSNSIFGSYGAYGSQTMDNLIKLLNSDLFAETLALGKSDLPPKGISANLDKLIDEATAEGLTEDEYAEKVETAIEAWRETNNYRVVITRIKKSVEFSYYEETDSADMVNLAKSFIYMDIRVLNDSTFAEQLFARVKQVLPGFVENKMPVPKPDYIGTNCTYVSTLSRVTLLNPNATLKSAVKYGLVVGAIALVGAAVAVILIDRSDKRLRNYELIMAKFNIPVLGVIPTIHREEEKTSSEEVSQ